jgi:hypothetical protein
MLTDAKGTTMRRPGMVAWDEFPASAISGSAVIGMTVFKNTLVYVTEDRKLHAIPANGTQFDLSDADPLTWLDGNLRPSFVVGRDILVIAGGGYMQKWDGTGLCERLGEDDPSQPSPTASHVCGIAQRLVALRPNESGQIWWSAPLEAYTDWDLSGSAGYIQAAAKPDPLMAMYDNTNEVYAFGTETLQVFSPDAVIIDENEVLDFVPSRTQNVGVSTRTAIVPVDDAFMVMDRNRRFLVTDGRSYEDRGRQVVKQVRSFDTVSDVWGFRMRFGRWDAIVWIFPTEGLGLVWDTQSGNWAEWKEWNDGEVPLSITSAYYWAERDLFLVGRSYGDIVLLDDSAQTDMGQSVKTEVISGFQTHGHAGQKWCRTLMLTMRREPGDGDPNGGVVRIWKRDDLGSWNHIRDEELSAGDWEPTIRIRSLGTYRQRQWKIEYTGSDKYALVSAQEEFENLGA